MWRCLRDLTIDEIQDASNATMANLGEGAGTFVEKWRPVGLFSKIIK